MTKHTHKIGDRVIVWNQTMGGRPVNEGEATIVELLPSENHYKVRLDSEPNETYERFVS